VIVGNSNDTKPRRERKSRTNFFHFVIFQNYDGSSTAKTIPRELYKKLFPGNV